MARHLEPVPIGEAPSLDDGDAAPPKYVPDGADLKAATSAARDRLGELQATLHADGRRAVLVVLQGRDASGKDGAIRKVFSACDPLTLRVAAFGVPSETERAHDYLWRVHAELPTRGTIAVFNRSHYEDVLAARVRGIVPEATWRRRFAHINAFEQMLTDEGTVVVKFMLHVSREEQRRRLLERVDDPSKHYKFREGDLDDRALWTEYTTAYEEAIAACSTRWAPWYVVPADDKRARDWLIADTLVRTLESLDLHPRVADEKTVAHWRMRVTNDA